MFIYSSVNITEKRHNEGVYIHVLRVNKNSKNIFGVMWCVAEKIIVFKLVPSLLKKVISLHMSSNSLILITEQLKMSNLSPGQTDST